MQRQVTCNTPNVMFWIGLHILCRYIGLPFSFPSIPPTKAHVRYRSILRLMYDTICRLRTMYDIISQLSLCTISISEPHIL